MEWECSVLIFLHQGSHDHWAIIISNSVDFACVTVKNYSHWTSIAVENNSLWSNRKDKKECSNWLLINTHTAKWLFSPRFLVFHMLSDYNKRFELREEEGQIRNSGIPIIVVKYKKTNGWKKISVCNEF